MNRSSRLYFFSRFSLATIIAVYFLILVGGIVRSTGSGMGCPDWPKCFGSWVPPVDESQLPSNYQEIYNQKRVLKGQRFSSLLSSVGLTGLSRKVMDHSDFAPKAEFNKYKTWTEYINRLIGVLIGLFAGATFVASISLRKDHKSIFIFSLMALILVAFEGWLGALVVSTHLLPGMVTVHMMVALMIVALLIFLFHKSRGETIRQVKGRTSRAVNVLASLCLLTFLAQIVLGTQVREGIDNLAASTQFLRAEWIPNLGLSFLIHRSFSIMIIGLNVALGYFLLRGPSTSTDLRFLGKLLMILIVLEVTAGTLMAYLAVPAFLQPIHLLLASIIFGIQFLIFLQIDPKFSRFKSTAQSYAY